MSLLMRPLSPRAAARPFALLLAAVALSACTGSEKNEQGQADKEEASAEQAERNRADAAWRTAVEEELGTDAFDFEGLRQNAAADCQRTTPEAWTINLALSGATSTSGVTRIGLEHACEDVVETFDQVLQRVENSDDPKSLACDLPRNSLSADDRAVLEMVCGA